MPFIYYFKNTRTKRQFWFDIFETVLESTLKLVGNASGSMKLDDWNILAREMPSRSVREIQAIFYPDAPGEVFADLETRGQMSRRRKFLAAFDHATYHGMYKNILDNTELQFPDIQTMFRNGRSHGKIMSQVMTHVGQWLNLRPMQINDRDNNKPQLWRDFLPAFREEHGNRSEELALRLQRQIFSVVHKRIDQFADSTASAYLSNLPADSQGDAYLERFMLPTWYDLLVRVHEIVGPRFQRSLAKFNTQSPKSLPSRPESSLTQVLRAAISRIPEIRTNPALSSSQALEVLMARIDPILTDWAAQQSGKARETQSRNQLPPEPSKAWDMAMLKNCQLCTAISKPNIDESNSQRGISPSIPSTVGTASMPGERHGDESAFKDPSGSRQINCMERCGTDEREDFSIDRPSRVEMLNA